MSERSAAEEAFNAGWAAAFDHMVHGHPVAPGRTRAYARYVAQVLMLGPAQPASCACPAREGEACPLTAEECAQRSTQRAVAGGG